MNLTRIFSCKLGLVVAAATLAVAVPAQAAPQWLGAQTLSPVGQDASAQQTAFDPGGDAVVVWRASGAHPTIEAAVRPAGGIFDAPQTISDPAAYSGSPDVAIDDQGDAVAVWLHFDGASLRVQAAYRPAGGSYGAPQTLSPAGYQAATPRVAMDGAGDAAIVWSISSGLSSEIQSAQAAPGGVFQAAVALSGFTSLASVPQVALDSHGDTLAVWDGWDGANIRIQEALRPAGGSFGTPQSLSPVGYNADAPQVAFDAGGDALAVWRFDGSPASTIQGAYRPSGGDFGFDQAVSTPSTYPAQVPQVAFDGQSEGVVVWQQDDGTYPRVYASVRSAGPSGTFSTPSTLDPGGQEALEPRIAGDGLSATVVSWKTFNGATNSTQAAVRAAAGSFGAATTVSAAAPQEGVPAVGVDAQGNGIAVWSRANGANYLLEASGYDGAGPLLRGPLLPSQGLVGQQLQFFQAPLDVWTPVLSEGFFFGDGGSASGVGATHAYSAPGSYLVSATASDVLGNVTTVTRTVTIALPPASVQSTAPAPASCSLSASRDQQLLGKGVVALQVSCSAALEGTLGGHLTVEVPRAHPRVHSRRRSADQGSVLSYTLRGLQSQLPDGRTEVHLTLSVHSRGEVLGALAHHRQVGLYLTLVGATSPSVRTQAHVEGIALVSHPRARRSSRGAPHQGH
jgi:hypothetical protein